MGAQFDYSLCTDAGFYVKCFLLDASRAEAIAQASLEVLAKALVCDTELALTTDSDSDNRHGAAAGGCYCVVVNSEPICPQHILGARALNTNRVGGPHAACFWPNAVRVTQA